MLLPATTNQIKLLAEAIHGLAFDRVFAQLKNKLVGIPKLKVSRACDIFGQCCDFSCQLPGRSG
jgi:hypothetical protein